MAKILDGKSLASKIEGVLKNEIESFQGVVNLAMVQVGEQESGRKYISLVKAAGEKIGIKVTEYIHPRSINENELKESIKKLNENPNIHGIIVVLPLDTEHCYDTESILDTVLPSKDVDGLSAINVSNLARGKLEKGIISCWAKGALELLRENGINIAGKQAVIIDANKCGIRNVGVSMANLLMWKNASVRICDLTTENLPSVVKEADILAVRIDQAEYIKGDWIKEGAVVIDFGQNLIDDPTRESGKKLVGDVDYEAAKVKASWITPVPGGVGPMATAMLMKNTVNCYKASKISGSSENL